ncbi:hypothetical protein SMICM304S_00103 [Streptomyces microflavus]
MASPFQAATTLSSRPGRGRSSRAASSRARTPATRAASTGPAFPAEAPRASFPPGAPPAVGAAYRPARTSRLPPTVCPRPARCLGTRSRGSRRSRWRRRRAKGQRQPFASRQSGRLRLNGGLLSTRSTRPRFRSLNSFAGSTGSTCGTLTPCRARFSIAGRTLPRSTAYASNELSPTGPCSARCRAAAASTLPAPQAGSMIRSPWGWGRPDPRADQRRRAACRTPLPAEPLLLRAVGATAHRRRPPRPPQAGAPAQCRDESRHPGGIVRPVPEVDVEVGRPEQRKTRTPGRLPQGPPQVGRRGETDDGLRRGSFPPLHEIVLSLTFLLREGGEHQDRQHRVEIAGRILAASVGRVRPPQPVGDF